MAEARLSFRLPADAARLWRARDRIRDYLRLHSDDERLVGDIVLAIDEACTNVISHSGSPDLEVAVSLDGSDFHVLVRDHGHGFDLASFDPEALPDPLGIGGRGFFLMAKLMDDLSLRRSDGLEVRMVKHQVARPAAHAFEVGIGDAQERSTRGARAQRARSLLEEIGEAFFALDWEYRCVSLNAAARRFFGDGRDALGRTLAEVSPTFVTAAVTNAQREAVELGVSSIIEVAVPASGRWLELRVYPTSTGASVFARDITARRETEDALQASEQRHRSLFMAMSEGFALHEIICDAAERPVDYRFLEVNPAFEDLTGLARDDVVGRTLREVLPGEDPVWVEQYGNVALTGEPAHFEQYSPTLKRYYDVLAYRPAPRQFAVVFVDTTERRRSARERERVLRRERLAEQQLTTELKSTNALLHAAYAVSASTKLDEVLDAVLEAIMQQSAHRRASVILWDEQRRELRIAASRGPAAVPAGTVVSFDQASPPARRAIVDRTLTLVDYDALTPDERRRAGALSSHLSLIVPLAYRDRLLGLITVDDRAARRRFKKREIEVVQGLAAHAAIAIEQARLFELERERLDRLQALHELTTLAVSSLEPRKVAETAVAQLASRLGLSASVLFVFDESRHRLMLSAATGFPESLYAEDPEGLGLDASWDVVQAFTSRQPLVRTDVGGVPQAVRRLYARYRLPLGANLVLPIPGSRGPLGVVALTWAKPREIDDDELAFLTAASRQIGIALENAQLFAAEAERARLAEALDGINRDIHSTLQAADILQLALGRGAEALAADAGAVELLERTWSLRHRHGFRADENEAPPDGGSPLALLAARSDRPIVRADLAAEAALATGYVRAQGLRAVLAAPLAVKERIIGCLLFFARRPRHFSELEIDFAGKLAASVSLAVENARLLEGQRRIATALQENFIHPLPSFPGLDLAAVSATASVPDLVGGDFSDVFALPDGRAVLLVGDVMGRGVRAAGLTATLRTTVRTLALTAAVPQQFLPLANEVLLREQSEQFATLLLLVLDVPTGRMLCGSAGHPPPVLVTSNGPALVKCRFGPPLGAFEGSTYELTPLDLAPEDALVLYTDGVTESRRDSRLFGEARLLSALGESGERDPGALAAALRTAVDDFAGYLRDDLLILAVRRRPEGPTG